jgi:hypothetical protein
VCQIRIQVASPLRASRASIDPRKAPCDGARDLHQDEIARDGLKGTPQAGPGRVTFLVQLHITNTEASNVANQP